MEVVPKGLDAPTAQEIQENLLSDNDLLTEAKFMDMAFAYSANEILERGYLLKSDLIKRVFALPYEIKESIHLSYKDINTICNDSVISKRLNELGLDQQLEELLKLFA